MFQIRIHGRGGQSAVTTAELLAVAAFTEDKHAQAFPSFGSERMGAPVMSFCRIDDKPIRTREPVTEPDVLIVQDPTLLHQADHVRGDDRGRLPADQLGARLLRTWPGRARRYAWAPEYPALNIEPPLYEFERRRGEEIIGRGVEHAQHSPAS